MVVGLGYTHREKLGNFGSRNVAVPESTYQRLTVTERNSGKTVTVYNQDANLLGRQDFVFTNAPEFDSTYNGTDITLDKRMSNGWMMTGGISIGKTTGWVGNNDLNNPNSKEFSRGIVGNDTPFSFRLSGLYELPWAIQASGTFQHQKGFPELTQVSVGNDTIRLTQGATNIIVEPRGTTRLPNLSQLDMSFRKVFRSGGKVIQPRLDVYNLMNYSDGDQSCDDARFELWGGRQHSARGVGEVRRSRGLLGCSVSWQMAEGGWQTHGFCHLPSSICPDLKYQCFLPSFTVR